MFDPTENQAIPYAQMLAVLTAMIAEDAPFDAPTLILWQNDIVPGPQTLISDLQVADYTGYSSVVGLEWGTPYFDVDGFPIATGPSHSFIATGSTITNTIFGWALVNAGLTALLKASRLATPVGISGAGQGVTIVPWLRYSGQ